MAKGKGPGATPKPSQSRKANRSIADRIYTRENGKLAFRPLYQLEMARAANDAPLEPEPCRLLEVLVLHHINANKGVEGWPLAWPTVETLMRRTGWKRTKLSGIIGDLARRGFVEIVCVDGDEGNILDITRDENGRWFKTGTSGKWYRNGYLINLDALEAVAEDPDALEKQRALRGITHAKHMTPCSQNEHGPCSESGYDHVRKTNTDHVRSANTKALRGSGLEIADDHNGTTIATATAAAPTIEDQEIILPSPERERSDPERSLDRTYSGPCSQNEHGSATAGDEPSRIITFTAEQAAHIAEMHTTMRRSQDEDDAAIRATAQSERMAPFVLGADRARDIVPERDAEL